MGVSQRGSIESSPDPLTTREREILIYLAEGLTNQEIASRLYLAEKTVRWYNTQIYSKLGVGNRQEAVDRAQTLGLLEPVSVGSLVASKHNLPAQATPFVGRRDELTELAVLLNNPNARLITILAPGGMGKTRLALETAHMQVGRSTDGVFFVPFAPLSSASDIVTTIAENIGFSFYGEDAPVQQLVDFLRERSLLLVLDNFEHLLEAAPLVGDLIQSAPEIRVLVTSRERLNLRGETVYPLRGLNFPNSETKEDALKYDAVNLFMQSAHRLRPAFELQTHDLDHLAQICRLTAGMPLGIELAAGWVDVLSLEQIAVEIRQGIDILETEMRDVPERQRSIRATFERTWGRLSDDEQGVFMRLSVFRGGFTVVAAQVVASAGVRSLRQLANKALVQISPDGRHDVHELLRQFGADKLAASDEHPAIQARHAAFFADFMQDRRRAIFAHAQFEALEQIGADFENVRSAWNVLVDQQAFDQLPKFLDGLWFFLNIRNRWQEGLELFEATSNTLQSLPTSDATELALARLWARLAWFYNYMGLSAKGKLIAEAAVRLLDRHDSPADLIVAHRNLALIAMLRGDWESERRMVEICYALARKLGDRGQEAHSLILMNHVANMLNEEIDADSSPVRQARAMYEELGDQWGVMLSYNIEAGGAFNAGDYEQAQSGFTQLLSRATAFGSAFHSATSALYLGVTALYQGNNRQAHDFLRQSLRVFWDAGYTHFAFAPLLRFAELLLAEDEAEAAVEVLAAMDRYPSQHQYRGLYDKRQDPFEQLRAALETRLGADRFASAWAHGQARALSAVVAELLTEPADE